MMMDFSVTFSLLFLITSLSYPIYSRIYHPSTQKLFPIRLYRWIRLLSYFFIISCNLYIIFNSFQKKNLITIASILILLYSESLPHQILPKTENFHIILIGILRIFPLFIFCIYQIIIIILNQEEHNLINNLQFSSFILAFIAGIVEYFFPSPIPHKVPIHEEYSSGLISYLSFSYLSYSIIRLALTRDSLDFQDVPEIYDADSACSCWERIKHYFKPETKNKVQTSTVRSPFHSLKDSALPPDPYLRVPTDEDPEEQAAPAPPRPHLFYILLGSFLPDFVSQGCFQFVGSCCMALSPLALNSILTFIRDHKTQTDGLRADANGASSSSPLKIDVRIAILFLFLGPLLKSICDNQNYVRGRHIGVRVRASLISAIFSHGLQVDLTASPDSAGKLSNLISVDVGMAQEFFCYTHIIWSGIFEICLLLYLLHLVLGSAAWVGFGVLICALALGSSIGKRLEAIQRRLLDRKDARMGLLNEILSGVRILKFFAWEEQYSQKVSEARRQEVAILRSFILTSGAMSSLWDLLPTLVATSAFLFHTQILHQPLSPEMGFTSLTLFNLLRNPLWLFLEQLNLCFKGSVSLGRLEDFLRIPLVQPPLMLTPIHADPACDDYMVQEEEEQEGLGLSLSSSGWTPSRDRESGSITLRAASFGWSSPLCPSKDQLQLRPSIWNRIFRSFDTPIHRSPSSAHISMSPQSQHGLLSPTPSLSDEEGSEIELTRSPDADLLVGHVLRGITLTVLAKKLTVVVGPTASGKSTLIAGLLGECRLLSGSFQIHSSSDRLSFAPQTAWIQNATIRENILFGQQWDEPRYRQVLFACALETDLAGLEFGDLTEIGEKGVGLSGGQQQRVSLARAAYAYSEVILMDDVLSAVDTHVAVHLFNHLILGFLSDRTRLLVTNQAALAIPGADRVICLEKRGTVVANCSPSELPSVLQAGGGGDYFRTLSALLSSEATPLPQGAPPSHSTSIPLEVDSVKMNETGKLVKKEEKRVGDVSWPVYLFYFRACGGLLAVSCLFLSCVAISACSVLQNYQLGQWVRSLGDKGRPRSQSIALSRYLLFGGLVVCSTLTRMVLQCYFNLKAAQTMHDSLTRSILRAPCGWFDVTPLGRIINRFSQDISSVDTEVMRTLMALTDCVLATSQVFIVISLSMPLIIVAIVPIVACTGWITYQYLRVSRELKRLDSIAKSPVFVLFSETLNGLAVIRSLGEQSRFLKTCFARVDLMNRCHFNLWLCNRWLNFRMQLMGALVAGSVGLAVVMNFDRLGSTVAGLALVYSLNLTDNLILIARTHADSQMSLNGVERIQEYCDIPSEKYEPDSPPPPLPPSWPQRGEIEFKSLTLQYPSSASPVLRDISFKIPGGKKVGVVGRSGAGKSSLIAALFRTVEPLSGRLLIDQVDVLRLPLIDLRNKLSIVPQDPVLFQGSLRSNLDPFSRFSDSVLWGVLKKVHMAGDVSKMTGGSGAAEGSLSDIQIQDKGSNLSAGQKQLICLARALLQRVSVLVLDECTASVDHETDLLIQDTIRSQLSDTTVLCIAHRLHTVAYYDLILVMDAGRAVEFGSPLSLMNNSSSIFHSLCRSSGDFDQLLDIAEKSCINNNKQ